MRELAATDRSKGEGIQSRVETLKVAADTDRTTMNAIGDKVEVIQISMDALKTNMDDLEQRMKKDGPNSPDTAREEVTEGQVDKLQVSDPWAGGEPKATVTERTTATERLNTRDANGVKPEAFNGEKGGRSIKELSDDLETYLTVLCPDLEADAFLKWVANFKDK